jgi:hypothetical protein
LGTFAGRLTKCCIVLAIGLSRVHELTSQTTTPQIITNASEITWNATQQHILTYFCLDLFHIFKIAQPGALRILSQSTSSQKN